MVYQRRLIVAVAVVPPQVMRRVIRIILGRVSIVEHLFHAASVIIFIIIVETRMTTAMMKQITFVVVLAAKIFALILFRIKVFYMEL